MYNEAWGYTENTPAKFPHSPILHYVCRSLLTENNDKNYATAVGLCTVKLYFSGGETMHNEVWGCAEI